jgi:hypothetical protein
MRAGADIKHFLSEGAKKVFFVPFVPKIVGQKARTPEIAPGNRPPCLILLAGAGSQPISRSMALAMRRHCFIISSNCGKFMDW